MKPAQNKTIFGFAHSIICLSFNVAYWNEWQIMDLLRVRLWDFWPTGANSPTQGQATLGLGPQGGGSGPGWAYGLCTTLLLEFKFFED